MGSMNPARFARMLEARDIALSNDEWDAVWTAPVRSLLTPPAGNPKVAKGLKKGVATAILHLTPAMGSGFQMCPKATIGCGGGVVDGIEVKGSCLVTAGRGGMGLDARDMNTIQRARRRRTHWFIARRDDFLTRLVQEVELHEAKWRKKGLRPAVRLNGTSDLPWERIPVTRGGKVYPNIMRAFPKVRFYDYTKRTDRVDLPRNYHLTFSLADGNDADVERAFDAGMNVAAVMRTDEIARRAGTRYARKAPLPATFRGRPVIDGDETDWRPSDPQGVYVGLRAKGRAVRDTSGFVKDVALAA